MIFYCFRPQQEHHAMLNQMQMSEIALARSLQNQYTYAPAQSPPTMFHQQQPMPQPMYVKLFIFI